MLAVDRCKRDVRLKYYRSKFNSESVNLPLQILLGGAAKGEPKRVAVDVGQGHFLIVTSYPALASGPSMI